jgi:uncharacterized protein (DUF1800 family)
MGRYLDMLRNDKPDDSTGRIPNENYAREIKQLFSIGLFRMWPDGTLVLNSKYEPIDTYSQREIVGFAHVFTGWDYGYDGAYRTSLGAGADWTRSMREVPVRHFTGPKRVLNNEVLPGLAMAAGQPLDPHAAHNVTLYSDPAYQALAAKELNDSHSQLFNHPNVGPFVCRQLIQRLVTSHPSRAYLYRVVQKFKENGERSAQCYMTLEIKEYGAFPSNAQRSTFAILSGYIKNFFGNRHTKRGATCDISGKRKKVWDPVFERWVRVRHYGYHLLQFERTCPDDSAWIKWDGKEITSDQMVALLRFDIHPLTLKPMDARDHHGQRTFPLLSE